MLTFEQIKELIEQVARRDLQGLELERSGFRLKITGKVTVPPAAVAPAAEATPAVAATGAAPVAIGASAPEPAKEVKAEPVAEQISPLDGAHILNSPIVGTFYRRPSPEAEPYAEVGGRVKKGQILCIVEAMKLMNEIESDIDGVVLEIFPQNAQPVEFGEPLFAIRPD